ncbi:MAG: hypothetical protein IIV80_04585 [Clostridia bacterium]|nr:hypothetical protein [Clostridia bacterium]
MNHHDLTQNKTERKECDQHYPAICPYYKREDYRGTIYCECARLRFPDKQSRREIVYRFCAHPEGYRVCPFKMALDGYYERRYAE